MFFLDTYICGRRRSWLVNPKIALPDEFLDVVADPTQLRLHAEQYFETVHVFLPIS